MSDRRATQTEHNSPHTKRCFHKKVGTGEEQPFSASPDRLQAETPSRRGGVRPGSSGAPASAIWLRDSIFTLVWFYFTCAFVVAKTRFHCVVQAGPELTRWPQLALNSLRSSCLALLRVGVTGLCHLACCWDIIGEFIKSLEKIQDSLTLFFFSTFTKIHAWPMRQKQPRQSHQKGHHQIHHNPRLQNLLLDSCCPTGTEMHIRNIFIWFIYQNIAILEKQQVQNKT